MPTSPQPSATPRDVNSVSRVFPGTSFVWSRVGLLVLCVLVLAGRAVWSRDTLYVVTDLWGDPVLATVDVGADALRPVGGAIGFEPLCLEYSRHDGFFYGVTGYTDTDLDLLVRIDPVTGVGEAVGPTGAAVGVCSDLAEDDDGQLWMLTLQGLYRVDRDTGAVAFACTPTEYVDGLTCRNGILTTYKTPPGTDPGCGLGTTGLFSAELATGATGWIYGSVEGPGQWWKDYYREDPQTGEVTPFAHVFRGFGGPMGLAVGPERQRAPAIPALGLPGTLLLTLLTALAAVAAIRRR